MLRPQLQIIRKFSYVNFNYIQGWNQIRKKKEVLVRERNRMQQQLDGLEEEYVDEYGNGYQPLPYTGSVRTCPECGRAMYYGYCRECLEDRIKNNSKREY